MSVTPDELTLGQVIHYRGYKVEVIEVKGLRPDIFGRPMFRFRGCILSGPDPERVGDVGELTYGPQAYIHTA